MCDMVDWHTKEILAQREGDTFDKVMYQKNQTTLTRTPGLGFGFVWSTSTTKGQKKRDWREKRPTYQ